MDNTNSNSLSRIRIVVLGTLPFLIAAIMEFIFCFLFMPKYLIYYFFSAIMWAFLFVLFYLLGIEIIVKRILYLISILRNLTTDRNRRMVDTGLREE